MTLRKISLKKSSKGQRYGLPRRTKMKASRMKKRPRKPSETLRIYGPQARRAFVVGLPCAACGYSGKPSEQAHVLGNGGLSRKADYTTIAPLCAPHTIMDVASWDILDYMGCHRRFDIMRSDFNARFPDFNPESAALATEQAWLTHIGGSGK